MRSVTIKLMFGCALLPFACSDDGSGTDSLTSPGSMSQPTSVSGATTESTTAASGSSSDQPTGATATESGASMTGMTGMTDPTATTMSVDTSTGPDTSETAGTSTGTSLSTTTGDTTTGGQDTTMGVDASSSTSGPNTTDTTTTGDESSSTGGNTTEAEIPCEVVQATLKPVVPNMMLVLDKSGSMVVNPSGLWDHDANVNTPKISRWNSLHDVVELILTKFNVKLNFGASLFPSKFANGDYDPDACKVNANVEIPVAPNNKDTILANIPTALDVSLKGGTPTAAGMKAALAHLKTLPADVPRAVLLVTDGAANCTTGAGDPMNYAPLFEAYDNTLNTVVGDAFTKDNIPTYVVGIDTKNVVSPVMKDGDPDSINPFVKLNELAAQGGKPKNNVNEKFYNATNQIELEAALDLIIADALSCVIPLKVEPAKPELTKVKLLNADVPHVMDCAKENGWVYTNPNGPYDAIELCGTACTNLKQSGKAEVNFFCVPN